MTRVLQTPLSPDCFDATMSVLAITDVDDLSESEIDDRIATFAIAHRQTCDQCMASGPLKFVNLDAPTPVDA